MTSEEELFYFSGCARKTRSEVEVIAARSRALCSLHTLALAHDRKKYNFLQYGIWGKKF